MSPVTTFGGPGGMASLADLAAWLRQAPAGTMLPASALATLVADLEDTEPAPSVAPQAEPPLTWRERLWTCPAETRLGVAEVAEALDKARSWVYARTGASTDPLPHRKLEGALTFTAGELRAWIRSREQVVHAGPMESTTAERRLGVLR